MLTRLFSQEKLEELFASHSYQPFWPTASDRAAWEKIQKNPVKAEWTRSILARAEAALGTAWADLTLTKIMRFVRDGNRGEYEKVYFSRRARLNNAVFAECLERQGRFLDEVADGIWELLSEPTWILPAHCVYLRKDGTPWTKTTPPEGNDPVPYETEFSHVDLFAAQTGGDLAMILQLLGAELRELSPVLCGRVEKALWERIVLPIEASARRDNDLWWLEPSSRRGGHLNNWTPWCCGNCFDVLATLLPNQPARLAYTTRRMLEAVDDFLLRFTPDGVCDEGPGYWTVAPGALMHFLSDLDKRTGGACAPVYHEPLIRAMMEYVAKVNLTGDYVFAHSDCTGRNGREAGLLAACAKATGSDYLMSFAGKYLRSELSTGYRENSSGLMNFFAVPDDPLPSFQPHLTDWMPDRQLLVSRQLPEDNQGTVLTAKGGNNGEGHNHNDVGQFSVFRNGTPIVVDVGSFTYTRDTFSARRYESWWIAGEGHNAPIINGFKQKEGGQFAAQVLEHSDDGEHCLLKLELRNIFPQEAQITRLERSYQLERSTGSVFLQDECSIAQGPLHAQIHLYSPTRPETVPGGLTWPNMRLETDLRCAAVEPVDLREDKKMQLSWGDFLYHIRLEGDFPASHASWKLSFIPRQS